MLKQFKFNKRFQNYYFRIKLITSWNKININKNNKLFKFYS